MPVWVRLHNLMLHFRLPKVFEAMGNVIGKYLKQDMEILTIGIHTFARICVEVDLSQGLPDSIILIHNNIQWNQPLDYENTAFRCRGYQKMVTSLVTAHKPEKKPEETRNKHKNQEAGSAQ